MNSGDALAGFFSSHLKRFSFLAIAIPLCENHHFYKETSASGRLNMALDVLPEMATLNPCQERGLTLFLYRNLLFMGT
jgi:hypothetical protein